MTRNKESLFELQSDIQMDYMRFSWQDLDEGAKCNVVTAGQ